MTNLWHDIHYGSEDKLNVIIEIPSGSKDKYELDKETGLIMLDRVLEVSMSYPGNYGFVPQTLCEDKDPLDVILLTHSSLHPGVLVKARPVGLLNMVDGGEADEKILAVPADDPRFNEMKDIKHVPKAFLDEIYCGINLSHGISLVLPKYIHNLLNLLLFFVSFLLKYLIYGRYH